MDEQLRKAQLYYRQQPEDIGLAKKYISILEQFLPRENQNDLDSLIDTLCPPTTKKEANKKLVYLHHHHQLKRIMARDEVSVIVWEKSVDYGKNGLFYNSMGFSFFQRDINQTICDERIFTVFRGRLFLTFSNSVPIRAKEIHCIFPNLDVEHIEKVIFNYLQELKNNEVS